MAAVVSPVVPEDFLRIAAPGEAAALLPVPGRGVADVGPLVAVLQIEVADFAAVRGRYVAVLKVDFHGQRVAAGFIKLHAVEEPEAGVGGLVLRAGIRDAAEGCVAEILAV